MIRNFADKRTPAGDHLFDYKSSIWGRAALYR
jgi:hypothetical protein